MKKLIIFWSFIFFMLPLVALSQEGILADTADKRINYNKSYFRIGLNYSNDWVYAGRKDSLAAPYLSPSFSYYHKSGLFVRSYFSYLTSSGENRIDMYVLKAGYVYMKNDFYAGLSAGVSLYNDSSYNILSEVNGNSFAYAGYDFGWLDFSGDVSLLFGSGTDILTGLEISHTFYANKNKLGIIPAVYLMAGTQNYYTEYYKYRRTGKGGNHGQGPGGGGSPPPTLTIIDSDSFKFLAWEFSMPIQYNIGKLRLLFTPTYAIPQNPSVVTIDGVPYPEKLENTFYWSTGISYRF